MQIWTGLGIQKKETPWKVTSLLPCQWLCQAVLNAVITSYVIDGKDSSVNDLIDFIISDNSRRLCDYKVAVPVLKILYNDYITSRAVSVVIKSKMLTWTHEVWHECGIGHNIASGCMLRLICQHCHNDNVNILMLNVMMLMWNHADIW